MKILIVGGSGFIGYNLERFIKEHSPRTTITTTTRLKGSKKSGHIHLDITDQKSVNKIVKGYDVIINLAGLSGVVQTLDQPLKVLETNTIGQLHILEACRQHNKKALIILASSRLEYGTPEQLPVTHENAFNPMTMYGISKYTATKFSVLYHQLYGLKTIVFRMSNPFGIEPRETHPHYNIVNHFIRLAHEGKTITIYGDGSQKRDYIFIDDISSAIWKAINNKKAVGKVMNIGHGRATSLKELVEKIVATVKKGKIVHKAWPKDWEKYETGDFFFDIGHIRSVLNWKPQYSIEEGISRVHHHYHE